MYLDEEVNQVDHIVNALHPMLQLDYDDYIDDDLVLDIMDVVIGNPYNDSKGLDIDFDLDHESILNYMKFKINIIWICNRMYL